MENRLAPKFNEILMKQNEIFSTICIEGKTNEASGRAPSDPPGAQKFKADPEQDPRVPIAFHPSRISESPKLL